MSLGGTITGIQEAQRANEQDMRAVSPRGALGKAVKEGTQIAHRYAQIITHVDTGSWKGSHRMRFREATASARGEVYIDPSSINPRHGVRPAYYASIWEAREGEMAVYKRTVEERGERILDEMTDIVRGGMAP